MAEGRFSLQRGADYALHRLCEELKDNFTKALYTVNRSEKPYLDWRMKTK